MFFFLPFSCLSFGLAPAFKLLQILLAFCLVLWIWYFFAILLLQWEWRRRYLWLFFYSPPPLPPHSNLTRKKKTEQKKWGSGRCWGSFIMYKENFSAISLPLNDVNALICDYHRYGISLLEISPMNSIFFLSINISSLPPSPPPQPSSS